MDVPSLWLMSAVEEQSLAVELASRVCAVTVPYHALPCLRGMSTDTTVQQHRKWIEGISGVEVLSLLWVDTDRRCSLSSGEMVCPGEGIVGYGKVSMVRESSGTLGEQVSHA